MAKKRKKKKNKKQRSNNKASKKKSASDVKARSWLALSALLRTGGGAHVDKRRKKKAQDMSWKDEE